MDIKCSICNCSSEKAFEHILLNKYVVNYFKCHNCEYLATENPYWLNEAYTDAVANTDTGIFMRNNIFSQQVAALLILLNNAPYCFEQQYLDYAGGYGIFVRLMRDLGFKFFWMDKYCDNIFSKSYEGNLNRTYSIVTSFEFIEHTVNPMEEIKNIFDKTDTWIFSTELLPSSIPDINWWYYSFNTGQHISFFSHKTFENIAIQLNLNYYCFGGLHVLTRNKISKIKLLLIKLCCFSKVSFIIQFIFRKIYYSKYSLTIHDMNSLVNSKS